MMHNQSIAASSHVPSRPARIFGLISTVFLIAYLTISACEIVQMPISNFDFSSGRHRVLLYLGFLNRWLRLHPNMWQAYFARGEAYEYLHDYEPALNDYDYASCLNPDELIITRRRARLYIHLGDYKKALIACNALVETKYPIAREFFLRSIVYCALHDYVHAWTDARHSIDLQPRFASAYVCCAYADMGLGKLGNALSDCRQAQLYNPNSIDSMICLAEIFNKLERWQECVNTCNKVLEMYPVRARWLRADAFNHLGNYRQAETDATSAICHNPALSQLYAVRAKARYALGKFVDAISDTKRSIYLSTSKQR
jgi:tetratricopeptide (TPR) repeat protein